MIMKRHKPIDVDASFLYRCPSENCGIDHWLFLREVKTKNFKIVCDCGTVFKPKTIDNIKVKYSNKSTINQQSNTNKEVTEHDKSELRIPVDLLDKCVKILAQYGFENQEAKNILTQTYLINQIDNPLQLIELSLKSLEIKNV